MRQRYIVFLCIPHFKEHHPNVHIFFKSELFNNSFKRPTYLTDRGKKNKKIILTMSTASKSLHLQC
jgi:hypothetical protein